MTEMLVIGKITGCYGIKGWVRVQAYTDPQENFLQLGQWHLERKGVLEPVIFDRGKRHGKGLVAHIQGIDDRTAAEAYCGVQVSVPDSALPTLQAREYYWRDLEGLEVWCRPRDERGAAPEAVLIGRVDSLIETGANDVLVVKACEESIDQQERLIPYVLDDTVQSVDLERSRIDVDWYLSEATD